VKNDNIPQRNSTEQNSPRVDNYIVITVTW